MSPDNALFVVAVAVAAAVPVLGWTKLRRPGDLADFSGYQVDEKRSPGNGRVRVTSLGTTTMLIDNGEDQILIDAFLTPIGPIASLLNRKVATDTRAVDRALDRAGADRVRAIFVSHSHHDHAFDVAHLARRTEAVVFGSESTLNIARGGFVWREQLERLRVDETVTIGGFEVHTHVSQHSPTPLGGEGVTVDAPLSQPARWTEYAEGGVYDFQVKVSGLTLLFKGSASYVEHALDGVAADVLFICVAGLGKFRQEVVDKYFRETIHRTEPRLVVPTHWNDFLAAAQPPMPFHRQIIDNSRVALQRLLARREVDAQAGLTYGVAILDAFASVTLDGRSVRSRADVPPQRNTAESGDSTRPAEEAAWQEWSGPSSVVVPRDWPKRLRWMLAGVGALVGCWLLVYGFGRWWPGCENFNTGLQQAGNADRAQQVLARCPDVTAGDVRVALLADTLFPLCYAALGVVLLVLLASSKVWRSGAWHGRRWCLRLAVAVVVAAVLDMAVENLALLVVTLLDWPPGAALRADYLLLTAALASWAKVTLLSAAAVGYVVFSLVWAVCGLTKLLPRQSQ